MRIVILSRSDCAGSGQRFAAALRAHGHDAVLCAFQRNVYGYDLDVLVDSSNLAKVKQLIERADVVHFKGDHLATQFPELPTAHKLRVLTAGGSGFRRRTRGLRLPYQQEWHPLAAYRAQFHAISTITPDLLYPGLPASWVPHTMAVRDRWKIPHRTIVIGHSPSSDAVKGTSSIVVPAVDMLQRAGFNVRLHLIRGVSNERCLQEKAKCHLFIDQCRIPAYGMSGVEALCMGIPVVQYLPPVDDRPDPRLRDGCPVVGFNEPTATGLFHALVDVLDKRRLAELHRQTLDYAERVHGSAAVARDLLALYHRGRMLRNSPTD